MNRVRKYLVVLLLIGVFYGSCNKDSTPAPVSGPIPPKAPKIPRDTFGYDGFAFSNISGESPSVMYRNGVLSLNISYWVGSETTWGMGFSIHAKQTGVYLLSNKDWGAQGESDGRGDWYSWFTDSTHTGKVTLTELDTIHGIVSGTFGFNDTIVGSSNFNASGTNSVKNGFFTWKY